MHELLAGDYPALEDAYSEPSFFRGIRRNLLKCSEKKLLCALPFSLTHTPFSPFGYYLPHEAAGLGSYPFHHAGAFYVQEPSASAAVTVLNPLPGERILDLCAAPGGKSTQIASMLGGRGLLWSNEYVRSRTGPLLSNLERFGVKNAVISSCHPETLCHSLAGYFDRVLVDAPCSGEGMFRRSAEAVRDWSPEHVKTCAVRQLSILKSASRALREGGVLVYSTCTFSREENENTISAFLTSCEDFDLVDCGVFFGRAAAIPEARRIYPMDGGEGHFIAKLCKKTPEPCEAVPFKNELTTDQGVLSDFFDCLFQTPPVGKIGISPAGMITLLPEDLPEICGLGVLRAGLELGMLRNGRVEPAHALFMASKPDELKSTVDFPHDSSEIAAFLRGEELPVSAQLHGYCGVSVDGITIGFGKCSGGRLKNHYPKGLRNLR